MVWSIARPAPDDDLTGGDAHHPIRQMTSTTTTLLEQLGGANRIAAMTGAQIVTGKTYALLVFKKQTGALKFTHFKVEYNEGTDAYDIFTSRMSRKTYQHTDTGSVADIQAESLKQVCEVMTGLHFSL